MKIYHIISIVFLSLSYNAISQTSHVVTFKVNTALITVGPNGIFVGGGNYGNATALQLTDPDGNGVFEGSDTLNGTAQGSFIFLNSPNSSSDWGTKENLTGLPCGAAAWNDRILPTFTQDTTLEFCFGTCSTDTVCQTSISFSVDMNGSNAPSFIQPYLSGTFNNWSGNAWAMIDNDGDNIWEYTATLDMNMTYEYKFSLDNWAGQEQFNFSSNDSLCTISSGSSINRVYTTSEPNAAIRYCYNSCSSNCTAPQIGSDIDGEASGDISGSSVSLSDDGTILAIGAPANDGNGTDAGHVRVYELDSNSIWTQLGSDIDGEASGDQSGSSVSLSDDGTILAIGASLNSGNGTNAGHVRVYELDSNSIWTQLGSDIDGEASGDQSGSSVSLSDDGTIVAIGAVYNNGNGFQSGHVRVYELDSNSIWTQLGSDIDGEAPNNYSGWSVSLADDGTILAIGAPANSGNGTYSGHVRVYQLDSNSIWTQLGSDIDGEASWDQSGRSVSLSDDGTIVAIGAMNNDGNGTNAGHVRVYELDSNSIWTQLGSDIDGEAPNNYSGSPVSLSDDGTILAIGAGLNSGNGTNAGHVRVYELDLNSIWTQLGSDIDGEASGDQSGWSVSLSDDGTVAAIGALYNDGNGDNSGHVRVYQRAFNCGYTPIIQNSGIFCSGDSIEVSAPSGAYDYEWSTGDTSSSIFINQGGIYSLIHNNQNCSDTTVFNIIESSAALQSNVSGPLTLCQGDFVSITMSGAYSYSWNNGASSANQNFMTSGGYYVIGLDSSGYCSDSVFFNITVNPNPIVTISGDSLICDGDSVLLDANGAASYLWNTGEAGYLIWADTSGIYSVIGTDSNGCSSQYLKQLSTVPNVNGTQIYGSPNVVPNSSETYTTSQNTNNSYSWQINGGAIISGQGSNSISVVWGAGPIGDVKVLETNDFCSNSDSLTIYISGVGLDDNNLNSIILSPNPNKGLFTIQVDQEHIGSSYQILDNLGRLIDKGIIRELSQDFDLSEKPQGVYRIQVSNDKAIKTLNVVIQ
jgi:hypothetical protein